MNLSHEAISAFWQDHIDAVGQYTHLVLDNFERLLGAQAKSVRDLVDLHSEECSAGWLGASAGAGERLPQLLARRLEVVSGMTSECLEIAADFQDALQRLAAIRMPSIGRKLQGGYGTALAVARAA